MNLRNAAILAAALLLSISPRAAAAAAPASGQTWLVASDIHLNPFERSPQPSLVGSDTNVALFESMLADMKRRVPNPALVLLPGDFFVHAFPAVVRHVSVGASAQTQAVRTMRFIAHAFQSAFPRAQFAIALGNNDSPCGDYRSDSGDAYLAAVARVWRPLVDRDGRAPEFVRSFARAGYYATGTPLRSVRLIVLNTVPFSSEYGGACGGPDAIAGAELAWLRATLHAAPGGTRNVVMMHVPPGIDAFTTQALRGFIAWPLMHANESEALVAALEAPRDRVAYALAGHLHRFGMRVAGNIPVIVFGAVSPVYHNNPAYYTMHVGADGALRDVDVYAYDEWTYTWATPRSFDATWNVPRIDAASLLRIHAELGRDAAMRREWDFAANAWPNPRLLWGQWRRRWRIPWCAQILPPDGFAACAGIQARVTFVRVAVPVAGLIVLGAIAAGIAALVRRRKGAARNA